jgi:hypothetical protein
MKESKRKVPSGKPAGNAAHTLHDADAPDSLALTPADEQIRTRAYELYCERGCQDGDDMGDWLRAEREYLEQSPG